MKRIIICSDGTMNTSFQTTRGDDQDYQPFSLEAFKANFLVWILGCLAAYYLIPFIESTTWKFAAGIVILLITVALATEVYLRKLRDDLEDEGLRRSLLWRYIVKYGSRTPSHVAKISRAVKSVAVEKDEDGNQIEIPQVVFYDKGIGTGGLSDAIIGGGFGVGLKKKVLDCYNFIAENYEEGDEVYLFGFSRGAFTVRVLSGLISQCGLLTKGDIHYAPEAYELFKLQATKKKDKKKLLDDFWKGSPDKGKTHDYAKRNEPCRKIDIHFLGVWDTVPAIGLAGVLGKIGGPLGRHFRMNNFTLSKNIEYAYQALGLDENRRAFTPLLWDAPPEYAEGERKINQEMKQRWFVGIHTTIGGGFERDQLSFITFKWMIDNAKERGLTFMEEKFWDNKKKEQKNYLDFFMPKDDAYKGYKNKNSPLVYLFEGFWKKRVVKLPGENMEDKLLLSDRIGRVLFGKDSINMRLDSQESVDETVYLRLNACEKYRNRTRVAEIPLQE